jgi:hypothetical protein
LVIALNRIRLDDFAVLHRRPFGPLDPIEVLDAVAEVPNTTRRRSSPNVLAMTRR